MYVVGVPRATGALCGSLDGAKRVVMMNATGDGAGGGRSQF